MQRNVDCVPKEVENPENVIKQEFLPVDDPHLQIRSIIEIELRKRPTVKTSVWKLLE